MNALFSTFSTTEFVGYAASALVLISFISRNMTRLRIINSVGCFLFVLYGFMLETSWPIVITNLSILGIHFYYLFINRKEPV